MVSDYNFLRETLKSFKNVQYRKMFAFVLFHIFFNLNKCKFNIQNM